MACTTSNTTKPDVVQRPNNLYGAPQGEAGRTFDTIDYGVQGIILHCTDMTISQYVQYLACLTQPVTGSNQETNHHYSIGSAGALNQHIADANISWTFGNYTAAIYTDPPAPTKTITWPTLQDLNGVNVSPDVYVINILIAKSYNQATGCLTSTGLPSDQHDKLIQLLAYLAATYDIPLDADHINWHDNIDTQACPANECNCGDIACLLTDINNFCDEDCSTVTYSEVPCSSISHLLAIPGDCANSSGCIVSVPFDACCFGDLAQEGDIEQFIGVAAVDDDPCVDDATFCLVKNTIQVTSPIIGDGTTTNPLAIDLCAWDDFVPDGTPTILLGLDDTGCMVQSPLATVIAGAETPLTVTDSDSIDLTASGTNNHTLTADVKVSATAGNQLSINSDGLFVDFTCADLTELFSSDTLVNIYGVNGGGDCSYEDVTTLVNNAICAIDLDDGTGTPLYFLGRGVDLTCPVFYTPTQLIAAGITVLDTPSIDLTLDAANVLSAVIIIDPATDNIAEVTANGLFVPEMTVTALDDCITATITDNVLEVSINIDPDSDNILTCNPDGLFVHDLVPLNTDCIDIDYDEITRELTAEILFAGPQNNVMNVASCVVGDGFYVPRGANALTSEPLTGLGTGDDPFDIDFSLMNAQDLCDFGGAITQTLSLATVIGRDDSGCLRQYTGEQFINQFLEIVNGDCITATLTQNVLNIEPVISSGIGGIDNVLSCVNSGLYVPRGAGIVPQDTNCIALQLVNGILTATPTLDPVIENQLSCNVNGLFVEQGAGVVGDTTDCIQVVATNGVITATPIISGAILGINNTLTCEPGGLFAPVGAGINAISTDCLTVTLEGNGDLTIEPIISPLVDNTLQCTENGFYVPSGFITGIADTDCITLAIVGDTLTAEPIIDPDINNLLECRATGLFANFSVLDTLCINLELSNGVLSAEPIIDPATTNLLTCGVDGLLVEFDSTVSAVDDTDCISLDVTGGVLTASPILAPDQGPLTNVLQCIDDGLYVPVAAGLTVLNGNCVELTLVNGLLTADVILDNIDPDNQVTCGPDGLHVERGAGLQVLDTDCLDLDITPDGVLTATVTFAGVQGGIGNIASCIPGQGFYVPQGAGLVGVDTNCLQTIVQPNGVISVNPIISPDVGNAFECRGNGMFVQEITVDDTNSIDLNINNGVITADLIVDPNPDNAIVVAATGVFVPEDFIDAINDTQCMSLDVTGGVLTATPIIDPAVDNQLTCTVNGLYVPQGQVITVSDTDCIDLDLTGDVLTATPIISGAIDNILTCTIDGLYVPDDFINQVTNSNCIDVDVTNGLLTINPVISPLADNILVCQGDGLYVPPVQVVDTDCINLTITNNVLTAEVIIDPAIENQIICQGTGLYVPPITVSDSNCMDLDLTNNVLTINPILSSTADNALDCLGDGLYVPQGANLQALDTNCIDMDVTNGVVSATPILSGNLDNILTCEADGLYVPEPFITAILDTDCLNLDVTGGVLSITPIISPLADNRLVCQGDGLYVPGINVVDSNCIDLDFTADTLTANVIISAQANNIVDCIGDGLFAEAPVRTVADTDCITLVLNNGELTATPVIDPALDNQLACGINGLYVPEPFITSVIDTDCLDLEVAAGVLTATVIIDPAADNQLICGTGTGLYVPQLQVVDTNCIDLTIAGNVLTVNPILSAIADNQVQCVADGFYVPQGGGLVSLDTDCIDMDVTNGVVSATPVIAPTQGGIANSLVCIAGQGLYVPAGADLIVIDGNCIDLTITNGNVLQAEVIVDPAADNVLTCGVGTGLYVPELTINPTDCIDVDITNRVLTIAPIIAPAQGGIDNILECIAGQGLYVPETTFTRNIGATPAGNNTIDVDTDGDGTPDFTFCEGFDTIVNTNDCVDGGVGADYMIREFSITDKTLTINGAPEHTSVTAEAGLQLLPANDHPATAAPPTTVLQAQAQIAFVNPSTCRSMSVHLSGLHQMRFETWTAGVRIANQGGITGGGGAIIGRGVFMHVDQSGTHLTEQVSASAIDTLPPGGAALYTMVGSTRTWNAGQSATDANSYAELTLIGVTI